MYGRVYLVRCSITGKLYVGQTRQPIRSRLQQHVCHPERRALTSRLAADIATHGRAAFAIELLQECPDQASLDVAEAAWVDRLKTQHPRGYNVREGGLRGSLAPETRLKIAARVISPETRRRLADAARGRPATDAQRAVLAHYRDLLPPVRFPGDKNPNARLNWPRVRAIRLLADGFSQNELARIAGISQTAVGRIIRQISWKE